MLLKIDRNIQPARADKNLKHYNVIKNLNYHFTTSVYFEHFIAHFVIRKNRALTVNRDNFSMMRIISKGGGRLCKDSTK